MKTYETFATVEEQGRILVAGVPFPPGTEVEITISPIRHPKNDVTFADDAFLATAREKMRELFLTIKGFRNSPCIERAELFGKVE